MGVDSGGVFDVGVDGGGMEGSRQKYIVCQ